MPDLRRANCRNCGRHRDECGEISWRGLCAECGPRLMAHNVESLAAHSGEPFQVWRRGMAASVGAIVTDDLPQRS